MLKFSIDKQKLFVSKPIIYGLLIFLIDKLHTYLKGFELKTSLSIPLWEEERNVICARALEERNISKADEFVSHPKQNEILFISLKM